MNLAIMNVDGGEKDLVAIALNLKFHRHRVWLQRSCGKLEDGEAKVFVARNTVPDFARQSELGIQSIKFRDRGHKRSDVVADLKSLLTRCLPLQVPLAQSNRCQTMPHRGILWRGL